MESQKKHSRQFSFEFFPPKTDEGQEKLRSTWHLGLLLVARLRLAQLQKTLYSARYMLGLEVDLGSRDIILKNLRI